MYGRVYGGVYAEFIECMVECTQSVQSVYWSVQSVRRVYAECMESRDGKLSFL